MPCTCPLHVRPMNSRTAPGADTTVLQFGTFQFSFARSIAPHCAVAATAAASIPRRAILQLSTFFMAFTLVSWMFRHWTQIIVPSGMYSTVAVTGSPFTVSLKTV